MATTTAIIHPDSGQRTRLARTLNRTSAFHCTGLYAEPEAALRAFRCAAPDVLLLDEAFAQPPGSEVVARLRATAPTLQILLLVSGDDLDWVLRAISRGVSGCIPKQDSAAHLLPALEEVVRGGSPLPGLIARRLVQCLQSQVAPKSQTGSLSGREREILEFLVQGYPYKQIADALSLSIDTVRTYVRRLYSKLQVRSRAHAIMKCRPATVVSLPLDWHTGGSALHPAGAARPTPASV